MRNTIIYAISGAVFGLAIYLILTAMAVPSYDSYLLHIDQYKEFQRSQEVLSIITSDSNVLSLILIIVSMSLTWFRFSAVINPQLKKFPLTQPQHPAKAWLLITMSGLLFWFSLLSISGLVDSIGSTVSFSAIILSILGCGFSWLIIADKGFGEMASGEISFNWKQYAYTLLKGMAFSIFAITIFFLLINKLFFLLMSVIIEVIDTSMENSMFGYIWLLIILVSLTSIAFVITFGMTPVFSASKHEIKKNIQKSKSAIVVLSIAVMLAIILAPVLLNLNHYKFNSLLDAAELNSISPYKLKLVQFCNNNVRSCKNQNIADKGSTAYKVSDWKTTVSGYGTLFNESGVPLNIDVIKRLENYILTDGEYSIYRKLAINILPEIYQGLWQPYKSMHAFDSLTKEGLLPLGPQIIWPMTHLRWLEHSAPINQQNRKDLEMLSDPAHFYYGAPQAIRIGNAWLRFGVPKKAEYFYKFAEKNSDKYQKIDLPERRQQNTFIKGAIYGFLKVKNKNPAGIRVGIFKLTDTDKKFKNTVPDPHSVTNMAGSVLLEENGKFIFKNLSNGDYYFALLVPGHLINEKTSLVSHIPAVISINDATNQYNLGEIRIQ